MSEEKGMADLYREAVIEAAKIFRLTEHEAHLGMRDDWVKDYNAQKAAMADKGLSEGAHPKKSSGPICG